MLIARQSFERNRIMLLVLISGLIIYFLLRAIFVSFTHDESYTVLNYVAHGWPEIKKITYTNNHFLNSLFASWCWQCFGMSELSMRLPNVIAGVVFVLCCYWFVRSISMRAYLIVPVFLFLAANVFVTDFFSLCRGYGLANGFMILSLYAVYRYFRKGKFAFHSSIAVLCALLATLANLTILNYYLLLICFIAFLTITGRKALSNKDKWQVTGVLLAGLSAGLFIAMQALNLRSSGNFDFGGNNGFWADSVYSISYLSNFFFGYHFGWHPTAFTVLTFLLVVASALWLLRAIMKLPKSPSLRFAFFLLFILAGCAMAITLQHYLFNVPFSVDRAVVYFIPIASLFFVFVLCDDNIGSDSLRRIVFIVFVAEPLISFGAQLNLNRTMLWSSNESVSAAVQCVIDDLSHDNVKNPPAGVTASFDQYPSLCYYLFSKNASEFSPLDFRENVDHEVYRYALFSEADSQELSGEMREIGLFGQIHVMKREAGELLTLFESIQMNCDSLEKEFSAVSGDTACAEQLSAAHNGSFPVRMVVIDSVKEGTVWIACAQFRENDGTADASFIMHILRGSQIIYWKSCEIPSLWHSYTGWSKARRIFCTEVQLLPGDEVFLYVNCTNYTSVQVKELTLSRYR